MSSRKKLLHLITGLEVGGTETSLLRVLPRLQTDFDNHVCCLIGQGPIGKNLEEQGIPVYYLKIRHLFDIGCVFRFRKILKEITPDLLITYLIHADLFGRVFGRIFGLPKIISSQRGSLLQWEFLRFFDRMTAFLIDKYIVQTTAAKKELVQKLALSEDMFEIIPNAIDISDFNFEIKQTNKKSELKINQDNINIVCVSNLRQGKGHPYLLEAFERVFQKNKQINLLIAGDGEEKQNLEEQVQNYVSKKNIYFLGKRDDVKEILKISDIFVLPTLAEGMSNAIMEAMASKLAIITTNIQPNQELITNEISGILVPTHDTNALVLQMENLILNKNKRVQLGNEAYKRIKTSFSLDVIKKRWTKVLNQEFL